jgi:hypothetical protein
MLRTFFGGLLRSCCCEAAKSSPLIKLSSSYLPSFLFHTHTLSYLGCKPRTKKATNYTHEVALVWRWGYCVQEEGEER